jgi:heme exporter protein D
MMTDYLATGFFTLLNVALTLLVLAALVLGVVLLARRVRKGR